MYSQNIVVKMSTSATGQESLPPTLQVQVTIVSPGSLAGTVGEHNTQQVVNFVFGANKPSHKAPDPTPFSFAFTGLHDSGRLAAVREGLYADLATTISEEAKVGVDEYLKQLIAADAVPAPISDPGTSGQSK